METFLQDVRHALRMLRQSLGFTVAAVAALALGIGANTAIFSVVNTVLLEPLPYPDPARLVMLTNTSPQGQGPGASPAKFNHWKRQTATLHDISAYQFSVANLTGGSDPEQLVSGNVTAGFFRLFGAPLSAGRSFSAEEERPGGGRVVLLSEGFWRRRFGSDPQMVGRTIAIDDTPHEVIGIVGPFDTEAIESPDGPPDVWLPFQIDPDSRDQGHFFVASGRLNDGASVETAAAQLKVSAEEFRQAFPTALCPQCAFGVQPLQESVVGNVRSSLWVLMGAVAFVLLIACANVANLLLVRGTARKREIAVRAAIGAGRGRIVRQLVTESLVLSALGGMFGLLIGMAGIRLLLALNPGNIPRIGDGGAAVSLDWRVLLFTALVVVVTGLVFGVFPALQASRTDLTVALKEGSGRSGSGFRQNRARALLVVSELGLALVLLVGAALFIRTFIALRAVNPGFETERVMTLRMSLTGDRFKAASAAAQVIRDGTERLAAIPGVEVAGASCCVPLQGGLGLPFTIVGRPLEGPFHGGGSYTPISPTYFSAFRIPVVRGRAFTDADAGGTPGVAIINQAMAKQYWPDGDPLADRITIGGKALGPQFDEPPRQIVGIVGDVRDGALSREPRPVMYVPWAQMSDLHARNLTSISPLAWIVRTRVAPTSLTAAIQRELRQASGGVPAARPRTMDEVVARSTARQDFNMVLLTVFAAAALLLAAIGIYGLMAYSVEQRTQEIGIRVALGADAPTVRNMIVRQGMTVALIGVAIGLASAFGLARVVASFLYGVTARDPLVFAGVPILLAGVALVGVWLPAQRAARVDPATALRAE